MKKKLAIMMAICLVAGSFNGAMGVPVVEASEVRQEINRNSSYTYNYLSSNSVEITGYTGQETELVIPSEIDGKTVTRIRDYAFYGCSGLTSIEIPSSVTSISDSVFEGCSGLTSIEIPLGVTSIGNRAFYGCSRLTSIEIPSSVASIGHRAFDGCNGLTSINVEEDNKIYDSRENCNAIIEKEYSRIIFGCKNTIIPSSVVKIGDYAFCGCSGLTSIEIPSGVTSIGDYAFSGCSGLTNIKIPLSVTSIGDASFYGCSGLTSIKIPSNVTKIGASAFFGCSGLTSLEIPSSVTSIGGGAFIGCSGLTSIKVEEENLFYDSRENCNAIIEKEYDELICGCKNTIIPLDVARIGGNAFSDCNRLTSIKIPSSVTSIEYGAFSGCSGLTSIEIPSNVTQIKHYAFSGCSRLNSIAIPDSVVVIGQGVFQNVYALTIYCSQGSYAEQYAKDNNFMIRDISEGNFGSGSAGESSGTPDQNPTETPGSGDTEEPGKEPSEKPGTETPGTPDQNPTEKPGSGNTEEPGKEPSENPGTETPGTSDQNPTEKPGNGNTEEPGKEPSENPDTEPPKTPDQKPTEKPGNGSTEEPTVSPDGKIVQTITAEDIVKTMGDQPFYLDAETDGDGTLTYESKNPDIVKVDGTGRATIVSTGTAKISVTASATDNYSSAKKTVTVTVIPEGYTPIYDIDDLYAIRNNPRGDYILVNDIDMSATQKGGDYDCGTGWNSIEEFYGTLDGNGHRIVGMNIFGEFTSQANIGLFETIGYKATIKNLGMIDCEIDVFLKASASVGALVGRCAENTMPGYEIAIISCYANGNINIQGKDANYNIGGLIGQGVGNTYGGTANFDNCYNACEINCSQTEHANFVGGICGYNLKSVKRCYNVGNIMENGQSQVGAIFGYMYRYYESSLRNNLNYLRGTAQQGMGTEADNPDCVALTESQMRNPKLFTGFDFTDTWEVDPYCSYPYPQLKNNRMIRINSIRLDTAPAKLTYNQGESLKLSGAALEISYEDGINTTIPLEKNMLSGYEMNKIGKQTVTVSYGGEETSFDIEVKEVQVSGVSIPKTLSLDRSKQKQLTASITPANASDKTVTWKSDNPSVASVSSSGLVKAKAKGTAVVTATAANGVKASCTVTVLVPAVSIKLSQSSLSMAAGSQRSIKAQVLPLESTDSVNWKSSNQAVAEVYDGSILAKKEGTAKITAYTKSGAKASCTVTVKKSGDGASSEIKKITSKKAKIKSAKNVKKKSVKLKLSGSVNGSGYKIQYGTSRKFKGAKTVTAKGSAATIKKLKAKKTYYIRARIYKKISGRTYYGKWSSVKSVKIKK